MASDKASLLKQRLRRGSDSFSFNALIEGVSTLEEPVVAASPEPAAANLAVQAETTPTSDVPFDSVSLPLPTPQPSLVLLEEPVQSLPADTESQRLRWALSTLSLRFTQEASRFAAAAGSGDAETAGYHLAQVNQALELLQPLDPSGDVSRDLGITEAPPVGKPWPSPAWSLVEFAESPFSGLLPSAAGESYARDILYSAWGVPQADSRQH